MSLEEEHGYGMYEALSPEYYDAEAHPTCANFTQASQLLLKAFHPALSAFLDGLGRAADFADAGCGRSVLAGDLIRRGTHWHSLLLMDRSAGMLAHSRPFAEAGAVLAVADSGALPLRAGGVDVVAAFMADPFNTPQTWREFARIARPGSLSVFTAPSFPWASAFRAAQSLERPDSARFVTRARDAVYVPSHVLDDAAQRAMMEQAGFAVLQSRSIGAAQLAGRVSDKLDLAAPIAQGYLSRRL
jgi:ubiquinone/menaquinone biosynthesis C-methylase UbiE